MTTAAELFGDVTLDSEEEDDLNIDLNDTAPEFEVPPEERPLEEDLEGTDSEPDAPIPLTWQTRHLLCLAPGWLSDEEEKIEEPFVPSWFPFWLDFSYRPRLARRDPFELPQRYTNWFCARRSPLRFDVVISKETELPSDTEPVGDE